MIKVKVKISLKDGILDPIGSSLEKRIEKDCKIDIHNLKIGKYIQFQIGDKDNFNSNLFDEKNKIKKDLKKKLKFLIKNIFSNPLIEDYHLKIEPTLFKKDY